MRTQLGDGLRVRVVADARDVDGAGRLARRDAFGLDFIDELEDGNGAPHTDCHRTPIWIRKQDACSYSATEE